MATAKKTAKPSQKKATKDATLPASFYRGQDRKTKPKKDSRGFIIPE